MTINTFQLLEALKQFTGTDQYYRNPLFPKFRYTDGVKYLAEEAGAYWLLDTIFSENGCLPLSNHPFQVWKLNVAADNTATISVEDGNEEVLKRIKLHFTDFPLASIELWLVENILILPSEY